MFCRDELPIDLTRLPTPGDGASRPPKTVSTRHMEPVARISDRRNGTLSLQAQSGGATWSISVSRREARPWLLLPALLFTLLFLFQGVASGATSVTVRSPDRYSVAHVGAPPTPPAAVTAFADVVATAALAGLGPAGTQTAGVPGLSGTPTTLPECLAAACRDRYIVASPPGLVVGDYAERVTLTVNQPLAPPGTSTGFLVEIAVQTATGWTFGRAYLATGTTAEAGGAVITVRLYLNLATATPPTIRSAFAVVDECSSATVCP